MIYFLMIVLSVLMRIFCIFVICNSIIIALSEFNNIFAKIV
jgi:hypothetical protein